MRAVLSLIALTFVACLSEKSTADFSDHRLAAVEELRIGSVDDPEYSFTWSRQMEVGPNGTIYTLHPQEHAIRVHTPTGEFVRTIGREGEGPGEFSNPGPIGMLDDTLWVLDYGTYRFTYFDLAGELLGSKTIPIDLGDDPTHSPPRPRGLLSDGSISGQSPTWSHAVASGDLVETAILRLDTTCRVIDTIVAYSVENTVWEVADPSGQSTMRSYTNQPFGETALVGISAHFPLVVTIDREVPQSAEDATFGVTAVAFSGDTLLAQRYSYTPMPIDGSLVDSLIETRAARVASSPFPSAPTPDRAAEWARQSLHVPEYHPPVSGLLLGKDGSIWLGAEKVGGPSVDWRIIAASGEPIGTVALPARFTLLEAENDLVWGIEYDELDVPYIVRYRLTGG